MSYGQRTACSGLRFHPLGRRRAGRASGNATRKRSRSRDFSALLTGACATTERANGRAGMRSATTQSLSYHALSRILAFDVQPLRAARRRRQPRPRARSFEKPAASAVPAASTASSASNQPQRNTSPTWWRSSARFGACFGRTGRAGSIWGIATRAAQGNRS